MSQQLLNSLVQGGPVAFATVVSVALAAWGLLVSGKLRFDRECGYRDRIIERQDRVLEEFRVANAALIEANRQQAQAAQMSLNLIHSELLPRLAQSRGA